jgi:cell division protein FtsL
MPVLTDEQHQELLDKAKKANEKVLASEKKINQANQAKEEILQQRNIFLTTAIIFLVLLLAAVILYFVKPQLLFNGEKVANNEVVVKQEKIDNYEAQIADLQTELQESNNDSKVLINGQIVSTFYAVQLGAFTKYNEPIVSQEYSLVKNIQEDGFTKYTIGVFSDVSDARKLRKQVIKLGFTDAFIGKYKNGKRLDIVE